jgi:hypothetical protein
MSEKSPNYGKPFTLARIQKAYDVTGLIPTRMMYLKVPGRCDEDRTLAEEEYKAWKKNPQGEVKMQRCGACLLTVVAIADSLSSRAPNLIDLYQEMHDTTLADYLGLPIETATGVMAGFDGTREKPTKENLNDFKTGTPRRRFTSGYAIGMKARKFFFKRNGRLKAKFLPKQEREGGNTQP